MNVSLNNTNTADSIVNLTECRKGNIISVSNCSLYNDITMTYTIKLMIIINTCLVVFLSVHYLPTISMYSVNTVIIIILMMVTIRKYGSTIL